MGNLRLPDCSGLIATALDEDFAYGPDYTSLATVPGKARCTAEFTAREAGTITGLGLIEQVLDATAQRLSQWGVDTGPTLGDAPSITLHSTDGDRVAPGQVIATVQAPTLLVLAAERTMLNMVSHASAIATQTRRWVDAIAAAAADTGTPDGVNQAQVRDTRKTLPGLRALQKYAVRAGGGANHRMGLGDAAMIKDNHVLAVGGSVATALRRVREHAPDIPCEVEVDTLDQLEEVLPLHPDMVLLDNFALADVHTAVHRRQALSPTTALEASGGLQLENAGEYGTSGVDFIAVGALTHSVRVLDIGLDFS
ncbi:MULTISPECIES: carboxylating nicotinate-nucleotide diphosphorylase [Corynebacterium]|jgi:nicotinate-nucleotide diphosphorylase (carboxylating)|uniref:carboxylating nicotinate-nucleotide diphosphorylase n=1 Tax=Corynebacterium TaxID=1716 RepID=UPI0003B8C188|nr:MULTISPECIES: carboxylating nicotinate-nucleotide diphosphorylase [Corynebacterium]ERS53055.1 nicotinate-nucleotide diphosphorylase (carboxylating) [Corynebacterium sp. KPL1824]MDK4275736.1 carboxylating nicotinate-nucleotide diphosphorylase [Corynebacterium accolens]MDK4336869.1 carboxylating nicotinate-nucleotide diphosphorylase [Corynebacterium accolens]MDK8472116.1 carboxylating nicotinate-nucleotide diphosphorylase [Corynebacterium accolens]MDK8618085.1 carboxylating nicotinate-nucleot